MTKLELDCSFHDLKGQSVLITGGGSGIGAALVEGFVASGAKVAFLDIDEASSLETQMRIEENYGIRPLFFPCDLRDLNALEDVAARAAKENGPVTILVNNAALDQRHTIEEMDQELWDRLEQINLRPQAFAAKAVVPAMKELGQGAIINVSSNSFQLGQAGYPAYVTAKAGIVGLTKALARELGPSGIRVNCLVPGWVMTQRQQELWATPEALAECMAAQSIKEQIQPKDMVGPALFLASKASAMMSGQSLVVDGGRA